jgi:hypothetical protein
MIVATRRSNPLILRLPGPVRLALDVIGTVLIALFLMGFVERNVTHQGDLKTYLLAARAALKGLDPYAAENLSTLAGRRVFPFVYPPACLLPWIAVAGLPAKTVAASWMWGKIALLGLLVVAWARWLSSSTLLLPLALVAVFGWNSSSQWDLAAGNVAILECGLIWAALGCYAAGRRMSFALLIVAAACLKIFPAVFLLLLLVPTDGAKASAQQFAGALALFALVVFGPTLIGPAAHYHRFWSHVPDATGYGDSNPSALGFAMLLTRGGGKWRACVVDRGGPLGCVCDRSHRSERPSHPQRACSARWAALGDDSRLSLRIATTAADGVRVRDPHACAVLLFTEAL